MVAMLALDAKVEIADFREPLTDMGKPRYLYSDTMITVPPSAVRSRPYLFPLSIEAPIGPNIIHNYICICAVALTTP